ncbi:MAG: DUF6152 family protein [Vicinamibacterales bacterium]
MKRLPVVLCLSVLVSAVTGAHHSTVVNFDSSREITIRGKLTEVRWMNPHSRFRVEVKNDAGQVEEWLVEMGAVNTMTRAGFPMARFSIGDQVTIIGAAGRRDRAVLLREAVLEDGTRLTPDMRPRTQGREASAN